MLDFRQAHFTVQNLYQAVHPVFQVVISQQLHLLFRCKGEVGTNKVKKEGLAYLHENEAVVPEKYNPAINDEVMRNSLMDALTNFTNTKMQNTSKQYGISELTNLMKEYMPLILDNIGQDIVLDDRTLVGKITPKIDKQLGVISANKNRGW
jgi:hypothetical protein